MDFYKMLKGFFTNWGTTIGGILASIGLAWTQLNNFFDADPLTMVDWSVVIAALGALGIGTNARDYNVSSEDSGAKESEETQAATS